MPIDPNNATPTPKGEFPSGGRKKNAYDKRVKAAEIARDRAHPHLDGSGSPTQTNGEEFEFCLTYSSSFTKGLPHNEYGLVHTTAYELFVEAINRETDQDSNGGSWFDNHVPLGPIDTVGPDRAGHRPPEMNYKEWDEAATDFCCRKAGDGTVKERSFKARNWESPRSGHAYDLQGADADALCMPPAPRIDSPELAVEMAEVYSMALLRDMPLEAISAGTASATSGQDAGDIADAIGQMSWFLTTPTDPNEQARWSARDQSSPAAPQITPENLFRGSSPGCQVGPYLSQFLLIGNDLRDRSKKFNEGFIQYGSLVIDQRNQTHLNCVDYMTSWCPWLDVQLGADLKDSDLFRNKPRFITTPRDLATYVHFDQLYEAYLNAALIMDSMKIDSMKLVPFEEGFPSGIPEEGHPTRGSFATFGGPHLLALLTEVSSRALRAVRRQKFNYHRRGRPELLGGRLSLIRDGEGAQLQDSEAAFKLLHDAIDPDILKGIAKHNIEQNSKTDRTYECDRSASQRKKMNRAYQISDPDNNVLLPMAFPEGSPMHAAYGAGHATVAGACVTVLKAFLQMFEPNTWDEKKWPQGNFPLQVPKAPVKKTDFRINNNGCPDQNGWGEELENYQANPAELDQITIQGELNKLAANISIGRNMAGVHYYSDYYDSLRMGERIAISIIQEQMTNYVDEPQTIQMRLNGFNGERITISMGTSQMPSVIVNEKTSSGGFKNLTGSDLDNWWRCSPAQLIN